VDPTRTTLDYNTTPASVISDKRVIETEVRYPILSVDPGAAPATGAPPATGYGSFPVVVFAHGYAVMPHTYEPLLDAWVRAGFVVVAPVFPVDNYYAWKAQGGGPSPENDTSNEPVDVVAAVDAVAKRAAHAGSFLHGVADFGRLALAGQSDGATVVAALAYGVGYGLRGDLARLPSAPRAVGVFSGQELTSQLSPQVTGPPIPYVVPASSPPALLAVQSDGDYCNPTSNETQLYGAVAPASPQRFFLRLEGADHLGPFDGQPPWAGVVEEVSSRFFGLALGGGGPKHASTVSRVSTASATSGIVNAGNVASVSSISTAASVVLPPTSSAGACGEPSPDP
jgi:dienelactone hydrolase